MNYYLFSIVFWYLIVVHPHYPSLIFNIFQKQSPHIAAMFIILRTFTVTIITILLLLLIIIIISSSSHHPCGAATAHHLAIIMGTLITTVITIITITITNIILRLLRLHGEEPELLAGGAGRRGRLEAGRRGMRLAGPRSPRGSKYPIFQVSGVKGHAFNGIWHLESNSIVFGRSGSTVPKRKLLAWTSFSVGCDDAGMFKEHCYLDFLLVFLLAFPRHSQGRRFDPLSSVRVSTFWHRGAHHVKIGDCGAPGVVRTCGSTHTKATKAWPSFSSKVGACCEMVHRQAGIESATTPPLSLK